MSIELELAEVRLVAAPSEVVLARAFEELHVAMLEGSAQSLAEDAPLRRRRAHRARPVRLVAVLATAAALVVAVCVVTIGISSHRARNRSACSSVRSCSSLGTSRGQGFRASHADLQCYVESHGARRGVRWRPQSVARRAPVQLICPTEQTCIGSGVDLGVDQSSLTYQQNDIEVSNDAGASWQVADVPPDGEYFSGFTCPSSTTCMTVGQQTGEAGGPQPPSLYVTPTAGHPGRSAYCRVSCSPTPLLHVGRLRRAWSSSRPRGSCRT